MTKPVFFNKGTIKGKILKSEIVKWEKQDRKGEFLSLEIEAGSNNKIRAMIQPTKSNPNKHKEIHNEYPANSMVEVSGNLQEREYESNGKKGIDRSVRAFSIRTLKEDVKPVAVFVLHGIVESVKETPEGAEIVVRYDETYKKDSETKTYSSKFTLAGDVLDIVHDLDVVKGCNAKFKGKIYNKLQLDEYGDIVGNLKMFCIEKIESVVQPDELIEEDEFLPDDFGDDPF